VTEQAVSPAARWPSAILVTGSSGYLGAALVARLRRDGHRVIGIDPQPASTTDIVGSITDAARVRETLRRHEIGAIAHTAALHKPHIATHAVAEFEAVNVAGTRNLLEAAVEPGSLVDRFVFTSTTSLMISAAIRAGRAGGRTRAAWIAEDFAPLEPRNIYGVTKLAAEATCRAFHAEHGLPLVMLRTSRFFPEEDDMAHAIVQSEPNTKANEYLFRRVALDDVVESHVVALARAPALGLDMFVISARTPFVEDDCEELIMDAPAVVARYYPHYAELYARRGWTMFASIDRVYVSARAERVLGFTPKVDFAAQLAALA
jgi:UDP-glucose 4-epimerase